MAAVFTKLHNALVATFTPAIAGFDVQPDATKKRKRPRREKNDPDKLLVISGKNVSREAFTAVDEFAYEGIYEFLITSIVPNDAKAIPDGMVEQWREAIQVICLLPGEFSSAVPEISHVEVVQRPTYSVSALDKNFDYTPTQLTIHTIEAR